MNEEELEILKEIAKKLDQLIILIRLSNKDSLDRFKKEVERDIVALRILEMADGSVSYSELTRKVAEEMKVAEITVKKKISKLRGLGFLIGKRKGKEVYYENSDLYR